MANSKYFKFGIALIAYSLIQGRYRGAVVFVRCGGLVFSVPATRSARPRFGSLPGASPQSGLRGGRSLSEYCTNKLIKLGPG